MLLSDFVHVKSGATVVDLCTGNGIIPVLLSAKTKAKKIIGVEILEPSYKLALRNMQMNKLEDRLEFINDDIKNHNKYFKSWFADAVTCNPPYMKTGSGFKNPGDYKAAAREMAGKRVVKKSENVGKVRSLHHIDDEDYENEAAPQTKNKKKSAETPAEESDSDANAPATDSDSDADASTGSISMLGVIVLSVGGVLLLAGIIVVIIIVSKKKK